ncbi:hypothetical protein ACR31U_12660 [Streptomyces rochei]|uniref:hypothetical protein n=1 Tax=Streptomyces TaxID=1883 RepID=UPI0011809D7B|nr:hypothetical protein [Streptomyces rochei]WDI18415.1 hypothetical protein PS783_12845 [Streptomyces enissocaesilis]
MKTLKVTRLLSAAGVTAAAVLIPIAAAAPASAATGYSGCKTWVGMHGYTVGPKVSAACSNKAINMPVGGWIANPLCVTQLIKAGVNSTVASQACVRAH